MLSAAGADLSAGTGPIVGGLHDLEEALRSTGTVVSAVRPGHFQEKVSDVLDAARYEGIYPVFAESADVPKPAVVTAYIGAVMAQVLLAPPRRSETIDLDLPGLHRAAGGRDPRPRPQSPARGCHQIPKPGWAAA